jgi:hypothetical protein
MSGIQLSNELVTDLKSVMEKHDPSTSDDLMFLQYLSAVSGFVLAHQTQPGMDKKEFMNDLSAFTAQVVDQVSEDMAPKQPAEDAFGIWKPGQS